MKTQILKSIVFIAVSITLIQFGLLFFFDHRLHLTEHSYFNDYPILFGMYAASGILSSVLYFFGFKDFSAINSKGLKKLLLFVSIIFIPTLSYHLIAQSGKGLPTFLFRLPVYSTFFFFVTTKIIKRFADGNTSINKLLVDQSAIKQAWVATAIISVMWIGYFYREQAPYIEYVLGRNSAPVISDSSSNIPSTNTTVSSHSESALSNTSNMTASTCEAVAQKMKMRQADIFCITPYYDMNTAAAEKFKQLMYNNQLTGINSTYISSSNVCAISISASGDIYGSSFSDTVSCRLSQKEVEYILNSTN